MQRKNYFVCFLSVLLIAMYNTLLAHGTDPRKELFRQYHEACTRPSDINEHVPILRSLAQECSSVVEIGLRTMVSSFGILQGLSDSAAEHRSYIGIDYQSPPPHILYAARTLAENRGIDFTFLQKNDREVELQENVDLLFIDSLHTYCHLTYELEKFSPKVNKIICLHDTSEPWGIYDDTEYHGDYSEYPAEINRTKRGLWLAVQDFLANHSEWQLHKRFLNNYGFTILRRVL